MESLIPFRHPECISGLRQNTGIPVSDSLQIRRKRLPFPDRLRMPLHRIQLILARRSFLNGLAAFFLPFSPVTNTTRLFLILRLRFAETARAESSLNRCLISDTAMNQEIRHIPHMNTGRGMKKPGFLRINVIQLHLPDVFLRPVSGKMPVFFLTAGTGRKKR